MIGLFPLSWCLSPWQQQGSVLTQSSGERGAWSLVGIILYYQPFTGQCIHCCRAHAGTIVSTVAFSETIGEHNYNWLYRNFGVQCVYVYYCMDDSKTLTLSIDDLIVFQQQGS